MKARHGIGLWWRIILHPRMLLLLLGLWRHRLLLLLRYCVELLSLGRIGPARRKGLRRGVVIVVTLLRWLLLLLLLRRLRRRGTVVVYGWCAARDVHLLLLLWRRRLMLYGRLGTHRARWLCRRGRGISAVMVRRQHLLRLWHLSLLLFLHPLPSAWRTD